MKQREIKFRIWYHNSCMDYSSDDFAIGMSGTMLNLDSDIDGTGVEGFVPIKNRNFEYDLMQFTGLKDKNGKEIFESDLLKDERDKILEVCWGEGEWLAGKLALNANNFFEGKCGFIEIIGNIYENPELKINK